MRLLSQGGSDAESQRMSRRNKLDSIGGKYEKCANALLSRIANVIEVRREGDFGIDFYCEPRLSIGPSTETVAELCSLQVKGGAPRLRYGGLNRHGEWKDYDFAWIRSLIAPLYLARVDKDCTAVELFSLCQLWFICWQAGHPFEVVCTAQPSGSDTHQIQGPQPTPDSRGAGKGDGMRWVLDLGPPFLRLTHENVNDPAFCERAVTVLRSWITRDRLALIYTILSVPIVPRFTHWNTQPPEILEEGLTYLANPGPGMNIGPLSQTVAPILVSLLLNLKLQDDEAAYKFLPGLEWLAERGNLDRLGQGLLRDLRRAQASGLSPAAQLPPDPAQG